MCCGVLRQAPHLNTCHHTASHLTIGHYITSISHHASPHHITRFLTSPPPTRHGNTTRHHKNATTRRNGRKLVRTKPRFGHRTGWSPCAHFTGKFFLSRFFFCRLKRPPPACPALFIYSYCWHAWHVYNAWHARFCIVILVSCFECLACLVGLPAMFSWHVSRPVWDFCT